MSEQMVIEQEIIDPRAGDRVRQYTASHVNERIDRFTWAMVEQAAASGWDAIVARLTELDREWNVSRALMANFAIVGGITSMLGRRSRGWRYVFQAQQFFLLMHAVVGWCPPLPVFRRLGFRTEEEICAERIALIERLRTIPAEGSSRL